MRNFFKSHPLLSSIFGIAIFVTIILVITALNLRSTSELELRIAPASATVTIDGKEYQNGTFRIASGEHTLKITKDGFSAKEYNFSTTNTTKIYDYILEEDGGYSWYLSHPDDSILLTQIGDFLSDQTAQSFEENHPVISKLPIIYASYDKAYNYTEYRIDGGSFEECKSSFCLKVTDSTGGNLMAAKQTLRDAGINPDDYEILYTYKPIQPLPED